MWGKEDDGKTTSPKEYKLFYLEIKKWCVLLVQGDLVLITYVLLMNLIFVCLILLNLDIDRRFFSNLGTNKISKIYIYWPNLSCKMTNLMPLIIWKLLFPNKTSFDVMSRI